MTRLREWNSDEASEIIARHSHLAGALLPILHALQETFGYIDKAAVPLMADALNLSHAEVHGVISFYHDFRAAPAGRHVLKLCRAESCQAMGAEALIAHLEHALKIELGETTPDRSLTVEAVYCLGNCACSPAAMMDGRLYGRLNKERIDQLVARAARHP